MIMAYTPYYAPYARPMGYYNPSIPQEMPNMQNVQNGQQMPVQQPIQQMPMQTITPFMQTQPTNDMLFVLNENEASAYPVAPNNSVVLWDKNNKTFYIKTANAQGIPSMQIYDFTERVAEDTKTPEKHVCKCGDKYATKEQISALQGKIEGLEAKVEELSNPIVEKPKTTSKKANESEE
jgi:hypothetical protein